MGVGPLSAQGLQHATGNAAQLSACTRGEWLAAARQLATPEYARRAASTMPPSHPTEPLRHSAATLAPCWFAC